MSSTGSRRSPRPSPLAEAGKAERSRLRPNTGKWKRPRSKQNERAGARYLLGYRAPIFFARARRTKHAAFLRARRSDKSPAARVFIAEARQCCSCWLQAANVIFTRSLCKEQSNMLLVLFAAGSRRSYSVFLQQRKKGLLPRERRSFLSLYISLPERESRRPTLP